MFSHIRPTEWRGDPRKVYENGDEGKEGIFMPVIVTLAIIHTLKHFNSFYKLNKCAFIYDWFLF